MRDSLTPHPRLLFSLLTALAPFLPSSAAWARDCRGTKPEGRPETDLSANRAAVRAGQVAIEDDGQGQAAVLLNGCPIDVPDDLALIRLSLVAAAIALPDEDVLLARADAGGNNACSVSWRLLSFAPDGGTAVSAQFGNCSEAWKSDRKGDRLEVVIGDRGEEQQRVVYAKGRFSCDTCDKPSSTAPVTLGAHRLEIRKPEGKLAELLADGAPTGLKALWLNFTGEPLAVGGEQVVLMARAVQGTCARKYVLAVARADGGVAVTGEFGNCTPYPNPEPAADGLRVTFPANRGHARQEVVYQGGKLAIAGAVPAPGAEKGLASLHAVYLDIGSWAVAGDWRSQGRMEEVAQQVKSHSTLLRHRLPDGRELLQVSFASGNPMDLEAAGCTGACRHYFYVSDRGRFRHVGELMGYDGVVTLGLTRQPVTLLVEETPRAGRSFACYVLAAPGPGYPDDFQPRTGSGSPCAPAPATRK
jgi:hypothetical protein